MQALRYLHPAAVIQPCFSGLFMLQLPGDVKDLSMTTQPGTGLMEVKRYAIFHALQMRIQYPAIITDPGVRTGLSAAGDRVDLFAVLFQIRADIDGFQHRLMRNGFMAQRESKEGREPVIRRPLVLTGAGDMDILPSITSVCRQGSFNSFRAFCDHEEGAV